MIKREKMSYEYVTEDGEVFESEEEAKEHEFKLCHKRIYGNRKNYDEYTIFKVNNEYELRAIFKNTMEHFNDIEVTSYPAIFGYSWDGEKHHYILIEDLIKNYEEKIKGLKEINNINSWRE